MTEGRKAVTHRAKSDNAMKTQKVTWKQLTIRIPVDVHRALRIRAVEEGRSMAVIIGGLVRDYLVGGRRHDGQEGRSGRPGRERR